MGDVGKELGKKARNENLENVGMEMSEMKRGQKIREEKIERRNIGREVICRKTEVMQTMQELCKPQNKKGHYFLKKI